MTLKTKYIQNYIFFSEKLTWLQCDALVRQITTCGRWIESNDKADLFKYIELMFNGAKSKSIGHRIGGSQKSKYKIDF